MSKERRTVSIEEEVDEYLARGDVNASGLVNKLLKNYIAGGGEEAAMYRLRETQLESEIADLESTLATKRDELERVRERVDAVESDRADVFSDAADALTSTDLNPSNRKVEFWASEAGVEPSTLIDEVEHRL